MNNIRDLSISQLRHALEIKEKIESLGAELAAITESNAVPRGRVKVIIQLSREEEAKALPILLRHSPGMVLPGRTYVLGEDAVGSLRDAGVRFTLVSREAIAPSLEEAASERV
jgi:hypothetical protein